jgi:KUP system potassium uptake protein
MLNEPHEYRRADEPAKPFSGAVTLAALGVVFGDIGTSPLYTLGACFTTAQVGPTAENVLGIISVLVWSLILVVCVKYVTFVMRVDYHGEGGIFALLARLMPPAVKGVFPPLTFLSLVGIVGGATLFGDGIITPAISVLSAVEGLSALSPAATTWEAPLTVVILIALFTIQSRGTENIGFVFGPVMALWFLAIAIAGGAAIAAHPQILAALDPLRASTFLTHHGIFGLLVLGATVLCVTGVEALYADMSHFGRRPIATAWYAIVFPALLLNYFGQGGAVLAKPQALGNAFYALAPGWTLIPMIFLATAATVIASQALISGAFTLIQQGIALNLVPRMRVMHTSNRSSGQVYVPAINILLAVGCIGLVLIFKNSAALASAYGLAVSVTMGATTILYFAVIRGVLKWNPYLATLLFVAFICLDGSFIAAGLAKIPKGGWVPLAIAAFLTILATTWYEGRRRVMASLAAGAVPVETFLAEAGSQETGSIEGTAVFFTGNPIDIPSILQHHWRHVQALHERVVLLTLVPVNDPYVDMQKRVTIERLSGQLVRVQARFGFMELPDVKPILTSCAAFGLDLDAPETSYVIAAPQIVPADGHGMSGPRRWLFGVMQRLAGTLPREVHIPADRLVQLGVEVRI